MRRIGALVALALLAGCNLAPKHVRPALPVPERYPAETRPAQAGLDPAGIGWRDFVLDARLQELIALALANNRDLRVSAARIEEARGQFRIQTADRLPTLNLTGSATRTRIGAASGGIGAGGAGGGAVGGGVGVPATGASGFTFDRYQIGVGITAFELDFWGRVRNLSEAARAQYLATVGGERAFRLSLIRDVAINYLTARELAERITLAESTVKSREEGLRIARLRLDAGVTSALDYRQTETLLTTAQTELATLRRSRAETRNFTYVLVGSPVPDDLPAALPVARAAFVRDIRPGLASDLLTNRPDIAAAEEQLRAARANIGAARAAFFPAISLTGNAGFASLDLDRLFGRDGFTWSFGPTISLPIFDWGRRTGQLDVARARETQAVATYEKAIQQAFREVANGLAGRRYLGERIVAQERALAAQRNLAGLARSRYRNGVAQYIEVLDAERNLFAAEQAMIQLRSADLQNLVSLYVALGGGLEPAERLTPARRSVRETSLPAPPR